ncbi:MAG TPA: response regulator [Candidatus Latescibacteria bacterium]|nr:response regulator [Candidatus Latescibacterota bacterium]
MSKGKILVVDDELFIRDLLFDFFKANGYEVILGEDGGRALDLIETESFDVALVDLKMPGVDGIEVARRIHQIDPEVPIILMTGYPSFESAVNALRQGVYDYVIKPFKIPYLKAIVERAINEHKLQRQNAQLFDKLRKTEEQLERLKKERYV